MAQTEQKLIQGDQWNELAVGAATPVTGFFTLWGDNEAIFRQDPDNPGVSETRGHKIESASDSVNFSLVQFEKLWARSTNNQSLIIITLDG